MCDSADSNTFIEAWIVEPNYAGWRLDRYLAEKLRRATRSQAARIIASGVERNGVHTTKAGTRVRPGDRIRIERQERPGGLPPEAPIRPLHRCDDWLLLHKPCGYLVHRTAHEVSRTVEAWLSAQPDETHTEPLHRLDRDTSGVLACARNPDALRRGRQAFAAASLDTPPSPSALPLPEKTYLAIVTDAAARWQPGTSATLDTPLGPDPDALVQLRMGRGTLPCASHVHCRSRHAARALLEIRIEGGRQHQIRAHLGLEGSPIAGDRLYAMGDAWFLDWLERPGHPELVAALDTPFHALHAATLRFANLEVHAPVPARWRHLLPLDDLPDRWQPDPLQRATGAP